MKKFDFEKTSIPSQFSINLKDYLDIGWVDYRTKPFYHFMFQTITDILKSKQSTKTPKIGFSILDDKGNFKFGAILNFIKPEDTDEDDGGNWYLEFTFDQEDMSDLDVDIDNHSDVYYRCLTNSAEHSLHAAFRDSSVAFSMIILAIETIINFLDVNADPAEEVELELPGIFTASVVVENDTKIMSIVPGEIIKQYIKNDSAL